MRVVADPVAHGLVEIWRFSYTFYKYEVGQGSEGYSAEYGDGIARVLLVVEGEHYSCNPLHNASEHECHSNADEYCYNHAEGLVGVEQVAVCKTVVSCHLDGGKDECSAQEFKHERHCCRCRHSECIEHVEDYDIRHHDGKEYRHHLVERVLRWLHDAVSCHIHHTRRHDCAQRHTYGCYDEHCAKLCHFGSDGTVEKVYSIIADTYEQVEYRKA